MLEFDKELCIQITATNDNYQATHFIRIFEVEVQLQPDLFADGGSSTMKAMITIIEDGMFNKRLAML